MGPNYSEDLNQKIDKAIKDPTRLFRRVLMGSDGYDGSIYQLSLAKGHLRRVLPERVA